MYDDGQPNATTGIRDSTGTRIQLHAAMSVV